MKKFITVAALLAAGTAFSNAATITPSTDATSVSLTTDATFYGICFTLGGTNRLTSDETLDEYVKLDSITINSVKRGSSSVTSGYLYVINSSGLILAASEATSVSSAYANWTFSFEDTSTLFNQANTLTLSTSEAYYAYFAPANETGTGWLTNTTYTNNGGGIGDTMKTAAASSIQTKTVVSYADADSVLESGLLSTTLYSPSNDYEAYGANLTISVSAIPEPSAFGLLAGVGALALVAARRRRTK